MIFSVEPPRRHHPALLAVEITFLRRRQRVHVPRMTAIYRITQRILRNESLFALPIVVIRMSEQDPNAEIDRHQVVRDELAVDDDARSYKHLTTPVAHVLILEIAMIGILESTPASQQDTPLAIMFVAG